MLNRGDTIIEVLMAVTVFSLVAVGSIAIMGRSANASQQAIEITLVRQQLDSQVEALRAAQQAYSRLTTEEARDQSTWRALMNAPGDGRTDEDTTECPNQVILNNRQARVMNPYSATLMTTVDSQVRSIDDESAPVFPQVAEDTNGLLTAYGLWIERLDVQPGPGGNFNTAYDFRVRACWHGAGMGNTPMFIETVVRLYES